MIKNNLRVWAVWDRVISRIEYLSERQSSCREFMRLLEESGRTGFELLRFDLSPLYYDLPGQGFPVKGSTLPLAGFSISGSQPGKQKTKTQKTSKE